MMLHLAMLLLGLVIPAVAPVRAAQPFVCSEAADHVATQPDVRALAERVYGPLQYRAWSESEPCVVPTAILTYRTQTVLISTAEPPFQAHACQATLTAHILRKSGKDLKLVRTIKDFAKTGESCVAGRIKPVTISGDDGFAVEGVGGGQGARAGWVEFYRFDGAAIRQMRLPNLSCTWVDYSNAGPASADMKNISSTWRIGGANNRRLFLDFTVFKQKPKNVTMKTEWAFGRDGLKLVRGRAPEAFADGACL